MRKPHILVFLALLSPDSIATAQSWLDEMATLDAQIDLLEKRNTLDSLLEQRAADRAAQLPLVISVAGTADKSKALLQFSNGRISRVQPGDQIMSGVKVLEIGIQGVRVSAPPGSRHRDLWLDFTAIEIRQVSSATDRDSPPARSVQDAVVGSAPLIQSP